MPLSLSCALDLPASSVGQSAQGAAAINADDLAGRLGELGIGTAHNTLANEEEEKTTGASSSNNNAGEEMMNRQVQINQLQNMLLAQKQLKVVSGATPMNT